MLKWPIRILAGLGWTYMLSRVFNWLAGGGK